MTKNNKKNKTVEQHIPKSIPGFFWHFLKPYKWIFLIAVITSLSSIVIDRFLLQYFARGFIDKAISIPDKSNVFNVLGLSFVVYAILAFANSTCIVICQLIHKVYCTKIKCNINISFLTHVHSHSYRYFADNFGGGLANKIADLSNSFFNIYECILMNFIPAILIILINLIVFAMMSPVLGVVLFVWMVMHIGYTVSRVKVMNKNWGTHSEENSRLRGKIIDSLSNFMIVKLNSKQLFEKKYVGLAQKKEQEAKLNAWTSTQRTWMPLGYLSEVFQIGLIVVMFYLYSKNQVSVGDITYILMILNIIFKSVWVLNNALFKFIEDISRIRKALDTLLVPYEIGDVKNAKRISVKEGEVNFDNITFHYGNHKNIFKDFSLDIKPGEKVGLVGASGAGKTTLVNLLIRLFDVQKGGVVIDGQDVKGVTQKSLRENISIVTQDSTLFHRTLEENIGYTKERATQKEIIAASKKADAHKFIDELPKKYKTMVGERGIKLSGGQRQRVNIARTILKDAPILILDEATSALDSETEAYIQKTFEKIMEGKTTIAIAHRLSTLKLMDRIVVMDEGKIVEEGTHKQLLSNKGIYAKLWKLQSTDFIKDENL